MTKIKKLDGTDFPPKTLRDIVLLSVQVGNDGFWL